MNKKIKKSVSALSFFTLLELIVVMAVFGILIAVVARFYTAAQDASAQMAEQAMTFENAKIALDLITRDIQCIYYENGQTPFWHWRPPNTSNPPAAWGNYRNELLAFFCATNMPPNSACTSSLCEVKYQKYYATNHNDSSDGWLMRSVTGNKHSDGTDNPKWNYQSNLVVGFQTDTIIDPDGVSVPVAAFTANSDSSENYQKVIPYVTNLKFYCYDKSGTEIDSDQNTSTADNAGTVTEFPYTIQVTLTVMAKNAWEKWIALGGHVNPEDDSGSLKEFRQNHERVFTKTIAIGNRGQYD